MQLASLCWLMTPPHLNPLLFIFIYVLLHFTLNVYVHRIFVCFYSMVVPQQHSSFHIVTLMFLYIVLVHYVSFLKSP